MVRSHYQDASRAGEVTPRPVLPPGPAGRRSAGPRSNDPHLEERWQHASGTRQANPTSATRAGVSPEKLLTLAAWYEDPRFDDAERAALALTEAATRLSDRPGAVTDEIWTEAARHYDEPQLGALVLMVALTNFFNRLNTTFRVPAGTRWE